MSNFTKFLINMGVNKAAVEMIGGRLVGALSSLNATNAGGYMEPLKIDGYTFNESDGKWYGYPPRPDYGTFAWFDPAGASKQLELNPSRYWRELNNHIERVSPAEGYAGTLSSPSLFNLLLNMPAIIARYREIAPDLWSSLAGSSAQCLTWTETARSPAAGSSLETTRCFKAARQLPTTFGGKQHNQ